MYIRIKLIFMRKIFNNSKFQKIHNLVLFLLCLFFIDSYFLQAQIRLDPRLGKITNLQIPPLLSQDRSTAAEYVVMHYFDPFPFTDTTLLNTTLVEQAIAVYLSALSEVPPKKGIESLRSLLKKAEVDSLMQRKFIYSLEQIFKSNNEIKFTNVYMETILELAIQSPYFIEAEKQRMQKTLANVRKNKEGSIATDLELEDSKGNVFTLHSIESPYILLVFTNPGCPACADLRTALAANSKLGEMIERKDLKLINVYLGEDLDAWRKHAGEYPSQWLYLRDKTQAVFKNDEYYIPAIPSVYLLGNDKRILLKDAPYRLVEEALKNL